MVQAAGGGSDEPLYCAEQIRVPPELPDILKNYTKHVIRSQPDDLLAASAEYFGKLAKQRAPAGQRLSKMQLESFYDQCSRRDKDHLTRADIDAACEAASIPAAHITDALTLGGWATDHIPWLDFWALLAASAAG
ncbi:Ropporin-1-like protein, partial [Cladochytrium tenue]